MMSIKVLGHVVDIGTLKKARCTQRSVPSFFLWIVSCICFIVLYVEAEMGYIAVFHDIVFAF